jgi:hypothetical protein
MDSAGALVASTDVEGGVEGDVVTKLVDLSGVSAHRLLYGDESADPALAAVLRRVVNQEPHDISPFGSSI